MKMGNDRLEFIRRVEKAVLMDPKDLIDSATDPYSWNAALAIARSLSLPCPETEKWEENPIVYCILKHRDYFYQRGSVSERSQIITLIRLLEEAWLFYSKDFD